MKVKIGDLTKIKTGKLDANVSSEDGKYPFFTCSKEPLKISTYSYDCECVLVAGNGDLNVKYYNGKFDAYQRTYIIEANGSGKLYMPYLYYFMEDYIDELRKQAIGGVIKYIKLANLTDALIELPSVDEQKSIVEILKKVKGILDKRNDEIRELDNLIKARFVEMFGDPRSNPFGFEKKRLKDTCKVITGNTPSRAIEEYYGDYIEWIKTDNIVSGILNPTQATESLSEKGMNVGRTVEKDSILMACIAGSIASIGRVCITDRTVAFNQQINAVVPEQYNILFLYVLFQMSKDYLVEDINMALKGILSKSKLEEKEFIIPPMDLQEQFSDFVKQVDKSKFDTMTFAPIYAIINLYLHTYFYQGRR
ncbi:restriction endonuclease subunit S [Agathobacter rectalis]|uniref:Restriction modification system, type I n=1 Tax=Agathobacter rectalis (strain ATCC 33656 / DSM 3377 / JCM 17463 / KCTC 5835 / VPI 0990) TaxID=515619 RepID=C4ZF22_AGARV|nr:restriction endonuclease subunit S [Agathobacter rectalis]ACR76143.1 restriction modification system, type I [Agathobacter rectalis ATCC 33656]UML64347.1 restriction endonuclease subunit S [Agathobacter rectalis]